jgi:hypothetical protein
VSTLASHSFPRHPGLLLGAISAIGWPQIRATFLFGLAAQAFMTIVHIGRFDTVREFVLQGFESQACAFALLVALMIADRAVERGSNRRVSYVVAALLGCLAGVVLETMLDVVWRMAFEPPQVLPEPEGPRSYTPVTMFIYRFLNWSLFGWAAVSVYVGRRAARESEQRLHVAELYRIERTRQATEARLQAMQARVEPQFLFKHARASADLVPAGWCGGGANAGGADRVSARRHTTHAR